MTRRRFRMLLTLLAGGFGVMQGLHAQQPADPGTDAPAADPAAAVDAAPVREELPLAVGVLGGYGYHLNLGSIDLGSDLLFGAGNCGIIDGGDGKGITTGIFGEYKLSPQLTLGARILREVNSGTMSGSAASPADYRLPDGSLAPIESENRFAIDLTTIALEIYGTIRPFDLPLELSGGPKIAITSGSTYELQERIIAPEEVTFQNGTATRVFGSGPMDVTLLFGVNLGAGWPLRISRAIEMIPAIGLSTYLNSFTAHGTAIDAAARGTIGFRYTFLKPLPPPPPPPEPPPPPPPPAEEPPKKPPVLAASIHAEGLAPTGEARPTVLLTVDERIRAREVAILPYVFFPAGSSELPESYRSSGAASSGAASSGAPSESALDAYPSMLATIGRRMADNPSERLTLTGTNSNTGDEKGNLELSRARAEAVRAYLTSGFGIDPSRIAVEARGLPAKASNSGYPQGEEENRRVEITGGQAILGPIVAGDTLRSYASPGFRIASDVNAEGGLGDWTIEAAIDGSLIRRLTGKTILTHQLDDTFTPEELRRLAGARGVEVRITASDKTGQSASTPWSPVPVAVERSVHQDLMLADTSVMLQDMILFDYNSSELSAGARAALARLKSGLPAGAKLRVIGYADETGDREYNRKLSLARARAVGEALGTGTISVEGAGGTSSIYPNDSPAGRFYSRSVRVVVDAGPTL